MAKDKKDKNIKNTTNTEMQTEGSFDGFVPRGYNKDPEWIVATLQMQRLKLEWEKANEKIKAIQSRLDLLQDKYFNTESECERDDIMEEADMLNDEYDEIAQSKAAICEKMTLAAEMLRVIEDSYNNG